MTAQGVVRSTQAWLQSSKLIRVPLPWLEACVEWLQEEGGGGPLPQHQLNQQVLDQWLLTDLRDLSHPVFPEGLSQAQKTELSGSFCVQLDSLLDVSQPAYSQLQRCRGKDCSNEVVSAVTQATQRPWEAKPTRMLLLQLTDGVQSLEAMEYQSIPVLSDTLRPGVKLQLHGQISCRLGVLLLRAGNVKILGGEVEELVERHALGRVLCRALGLPEEEPPWGALEQRDAPLRPGNLQEPEELDDMDDQELLASLEAQERQGGWGVAPSLESGYGSRSEASSASYRSASVQSRHFDSLGDSAFVSSPSRHGPPPEPDMMEDIPDEDFDDLPLDELDSVIFQGSPQDNIPIKPPTLRVRNGAESGSSVTQESMSGSRANHRDGLRRGQVEAPPTHLHSANPPSDDVMRNGSHFDSFDSLDERDPFPEDEDMDCFFPLEPNPPREEPPSPQPTHPHPQPLATRLDRASVQQEPEASKQETTMENPPTRHPQPRQASGSRPERVSGETEPETSASLTLDSPPFTYLCLLQGGGWGATPQAMPEGGEGVSEVRVKAFIVTLLGNLLSSTGAWQVSASISDGTGYLDVELSDPVLTGLLGFSVAEKGLLKRDPARKSQMEAGMRACQQGMVDMCCLMTLRLDPGGGGKVTVVRADQVTEDDCLALENRVRGREGL